MAIKRYTANADTTITNAFKAGLTTRGTGSNMGMSDSLEIFSIYGQTISGSNAAKTAELSRVLINFPVTDINTDRTNGDIPASGSVSFYLRMFNAKHPFTVPRSFTLSASAVTADWQEGRGLDMEGYRDLTYDAEGANWMNANGNFTAATATIQFNSATASDYDDETFTVTSTDGTEVVYTLNDDSTSNTYGANATSIGIQGAPAASKVSELMTAAGNNSSNAHYGKITFVEGASATVTLTQDVSGRAGNNTVTTTDSTDITVSGFTGGDGLWTRPGGDYDTGEGSTFQQTFEKGTEDLEIDVTTLVEQWLHSPGNVLGDKSSARYGFGVHLTSSQEAKYENTDMTDGTNGLLKNPTGSTDSYYTKKFFARGSEYFFKRPVIEARWDSSKKDNRGNFYLSSSLATGDDNLNTLYLYNYVRGQLKNIPKLAGSGFKRAAGEVTITEASNLGTSAYGTITVANEGWMEAGDTISLISTDQTTIVCTINADGGATTSAALSGDVEAAIVNGSTADTATNIAQAINHNTYFIATAASNVVTVTQAVVGDAGDTVITITEGGATGLTKADFANGADATTVAIVTTDGTTITATADKSTTTTTDTNSPTFKIVTGPQGEHLTADELHTCLNANSKLIATSDNESAIVTITQDVAGEDGNTTITLTDPGGTGASKADFTGGTDGNAAKTKLDVRIYPTLGSDAKTLPVGGAVTANDAFVVTASYIASGTYSASFAYTGSETTIYDVWSTGSATAHRGSGASYIEFHTGSGIAVKSFESYEHNPNETYTTSIKNLKSIYSNEETARFRLFARNKNWSPNIYTKATTEISFSIIENVYYKVFRVHDNLTVLDYGTGSLNHTRASYDVSGSYFDLDMSILQNDYMYGIKIVYYLNGKYVEQPETFKFRVEKHSTDIE